MSRLGQSSEDPPLMAAGWSMRDEGFPNFREIIPTTSADAAAPPAPTQAKHEVQATPGQTTVGR